MFLNVLEDGGLRPLTVVQVTWNAFALEVECCAVPWLCRVYPSARSTSLRVCTYTPTQGSLTLLRDDDGNVAQPLRFIVPEWVFPDLSKLQDPVFLIGSPSPPDPSR